MDDLISRQAAIDALCSVCGYDCDKSEFIYNAPQDEQVILCPEHYVLTQLPSAQPEIIRCNACKHWNQTSGETKGFGLGECDFHDAKFVTCNGYCYWAERRTDEQTD